MTPGSLWMLHTESNHSIASPITYLWMSSIAGSKAHCYQYMNYTCYLRVTDMSRPILASLAVVWVPTTLLPSPISINSSSDPFRNQDMDSRHRRRLWRLYFGVLLMFPGRHDRTANKQRAEIKSAQVIQCEVCPINLSKEKRRCRQDILLCVCHTHIKIDHWDYVNI